MYFFALRNPLTQARDAMRMARYDMALEALDTVPAWLRNWPTLAALRAKAGLGARTYQSPPDWESIIKDLRRQRADRPTDASRLYAEHVERPFYPPLRLFVTSGPSVAMIVEGDEAVDVVRTINGATDGRKAAPGTIRGDFALSNRENLVHGSDSLESAKREIALWFPDLA